MVRLLAPVLGSSQYRLRTALPLLLLALLIVAGIPFPIGPTLAAGLPISFKAPVKLVQGSDPMANPASFNRPTSIAYFQGRLYVATYSGNIWIFTLNTAGTVADLTKTRVISAVAQTPNYNDDGSPAPSSYQGRRMMLGLLVAPESTADRVVLYASHSDPRWGGTDGSRRDIDSHSGMVTRVTVPASAFAIGTGQNIDRLVAVHNVLVGLPRSGENHATNGMAWGADGWLYIAQGSNTNAGTPGSAFGNRAETPLTAAVLRAKISDPFFQGNSLDVSVIQTLADLDRPAFAGKFELFAGGYRNPYDLVYHSNGSIYLNNNGPNAGMGTTPDSTLGCATPSFDTGTIGDALHRVVKNAYGGHPAPIRGQCVLNGGNPTSLPDPFEMPTYPVGTQPDPRFLPPLITYGDEGRATQGIAEYASNAFGGAMRGDLIIANFGGPRYVSHIPLGVDGKPTVQKPIKLAGGMGKLIDVAVNPNGVIYVASLQAPLNDPTGAGNAIYALTPTSPGTTCPLPGSSITNDSDGDDYKDQDEQLSSTDPCSAADAPEDADNDKVGDLLDPDDDNDGLPDLDDQLLFDPANGAATSLPLQIDWFPTTSYGGIKQSGMLGALINACASASGEGCPTRRLDPSDLSVGGAAGLLGIPARPGSIQGPANNHGNVLLVGLDATRSFSITTRISAEFFNASAPGRQGDLIFGINADNYVVVGAGNFAGRSGIAAGIELDGIFTTTATPDGPSAFELDGDSATPPGTIDLFIDGDAQSKTLTLAYRLDDGPLRAVSTVSAAQYPQLTQLFTKGRARSSTQAAANGAVVGLMASKLAGDTATVQVGFDWLFITPMGGPSPFSPATIAIEPTTPVALPDTPVEIRARVRDRFDDPVADGTPVTFRTSYGSFANGRQEMMVPSVGGVATLTLSANQSGTATVSAEANEAKTDITITFASNKPASLMLSTATPSVTISTATVITAEVHDQLGQPVPDGTEVVLTTTLGTFNNNQPQIRATTANGLIEVTLTAVTPGAADIVATAGDVRATLQLTIVTPPASPPSPTSPPAPRSPSVYIPLLLQ